MRPRRHPPFSPFHLLVALLCLAFVSRLTAASLAVSFTQAPQPSPAAPNVSVSATAEALYTGDAPPQNQSQVTGTVQYRWKWEFGSAGTVTSSTPASGEDGWSAWGNYPQSTATGTFNQAGLLSVTATAEARVVDENSNVLAAAVSGSASEAVTSVGLYGVEVLVGDTWEAVGDTFLGTPATAYTFRAVRWPLDSEWPGGVPSWSVGGSSAGSGGDLAITVPATISDSVAVTVSDGGVTYSFSVVVAAVYAQCGHLEVYAYSQWIENYWEYSCVFSWDYDPVPQRIYRIIKDNPALSWKGGYPVWQTLTTGLTGSGDTFTVPYPTVHRPEREFVECRWGAAPEEYIRFLVRYIEGTEDYIVEAPLCMAKGGYACATPGYVGYASEWSTSPSGIVELRDSWNVTAALVQGPPNNWHNHVTLYGASVGATVLTIRWPYDESYYPHPNCATTASRWVRVLELAGVQAYCDAPISETVAWPPSDPGTTESIATKYVPAILGTPLRLASVYYGACVDDRLYIRHAIDYTWEGTETRLYDRSLAEFSYALTTISRVGTYTCRAGIDSYGVGDGRFEATPETVARLVIQAVGLDSLAIVCSSGGTTLLNRAYSEADQSAFYAWPDKTGAALSVAVEATGTATHDLWPSGYPLWTGCSSPTGTAGSSEGVANSVNGATVTTPGTTEIEAECGNAIAVRLHGVQIDVDAPGVAESDETAANGGICFQTGDTDRVALTVNRAPTGLDRGTIRVSCSGTTGGFRLWSGTSTRFPSASFPGTVSSVDLPLGSGTTVGSALPTTIYLEPTGSSFSSTLTIQYLNPAGQAVDSDSLYIHTGY